MCVVCTFFFGPIQIKILATKVSRSTTTGQSVIQRSAQHSMADNEEVAHKTSAIVGDVFNKWHKSNGTNMEPHMAWLTACDTGRTIPPRLLWMVQRCRRSPVRETISVAFNKVLQLPSSTCGQEMGMGMGPPTEFWKGHKHALAALDTLMEYVWEHFNSGHWKDTPSYWRLIYSWLAGSKVVLMAIQPGISSAELIKICDVALLIGTPLPALADIFSEIAARLNAMVSTENRTPLLFVSESCECDEALERSKCPFFSIQQRSGCEMGIPVEDAPTLEAFVSSYYTKQHPVLIHGAMESWPALNKWSPQHIANVAGCRTVPVELGSNYIAKDWTQKLMTIHEFVDTYITGTGSRAAAAEIGYLAQHQLLDQVPELRNDIQVPEYCLVGENDAVEINTWFGPAGTVTPTHYDAKHNVLTQVFGSKLVILFPPSETKYLYPHGDGSILFNTSQVNIEDPSDYETFPDALKASYHVVFLHAGDMLYIPKNCWHFVRSLTPSFSLSFWFE